MKRIVHDLVQGTEEWDEFRLEHDGASEAAAMLGISKKTSRSELLRMKATGIAKEFSAWVQAHILDYGHEVEAMARPIAEEIIGEELFPATYSFGRLSASCDGLTMDGSTAFEHKQWAEALAESVSRNELPEEHYPQCQQVLYVTGADRLLFMVSNGTKDQCVWMWVYPDPSWVKRLLGGWKQFAEDLANYKPVEVIPAAVAAPTEGFGALVLQVEGRVVACNIDAFRAGASAFLGRLPKPEELNSDQDFANAESAVKACSEAEAKIKAAKDAGLAQMSEVDTVLRVADQIVAEIAAARIALTKSVDARKVTIRNEIMQKGKDALSEHIATLNKRLGRVQIPAVTADFVGAIKGKRTVESLRNAVDTVLANAKITANEIADKIQINLATLDESKEHAFLFNDVATLVMKAPDDLANVIKLRIAEHNAEQQRRLDAERERIRAEEQAKAQQPQKLNAAEGTAITAAPSTSTDQPAQPSVVSPIKTGAESVEQDTAWKIAGLVGEMNEMERCRVLQFCERVIEARKAEA